jgi:hypothetical protein
MAIIAEVISRIRGQAKAYNQDAFVTDRYIYSLVQKFSQVLMRRQDSANKLMKFNSIWKSLPYVELIEVDRIEAQCSGLKSDCTFMRTKEELPTMIEGFWGPLIRSVSSIDGSQVLQPIQPSIYLAMEGTTSFRYNKTKYFWFIDHHLYFPNLEWDAVKIEAVFDSDISNWQCDNKCVPHYDQDINIPEFLLAEVEAQVLNIMTNTIKIPSDNADNKINIHRS